MKKNQPKFHCILHGSFRKHFPEIQRIHRLFTEAGINVLAPSLSEIIAVRDGFALLRDDPKSDSRLIEMLYLRQIKHLGRTGFSYFVNPDGYIGSSTSYELGIAQAANVPCFFLEKPSDHPVYLPQNCLWKPELLIEWIHDHQSLPEPQIHPDEETIHRLWQAVMPPSATVAVGGILEYRPSRTAAPKEILLVKTHKWGGRYSIVGGKVQRAEDLPGALRREVRVQTGLSARIGQHLCTFDQLKNSGYYQRRVRHIFVDNIVQVESKEVCLNDEAQSFVWLPAHEALTNLDIEPNARHTIERYLQFQSTSF